MVELTKKPILDRQVALSTAIVQAQYNLDIGEKSLICLALAGINQYEEIVVGTEHKVTLEDFAYLRGEKTDDGTITPLRKDNARRDINLAIKKLYESTIKLRTGEEHRWITGYKNTIRTEEDYIILKWNPDLIPELAKLKSYANLLAKSLAGIKGKYTTRILELVSQEKFKGYSSGSVYVSLDEFLFMIHAVDTYKEFKYLNRYVLIPSIRELRELEIVSIEIETKKVNRKTVGFWLKYSF